MLVRGLRVQGVTSLKLVLYFFAKKKTRAPIGIRGEGRRGSGAMVPIIGKGIASALSLMSFGSFRKTFTYSGNIPKTNRLMRAILARGRGGGGAVILSIKSGFDKDCFSEVAENGPLPRVFRRVSMGVSTMNGRRFS